MDCGAATPVAGKKIWACSTCGFSAKEDSSERAARILLERELGMPLGKVEEGNQPTPDYRTARSEAVVEVKQVTTEMFREAVGVQQQLSMDSSRLAGRWMVQVDLATLPLLFPDSDDNSGPPGAAPLHGGRKPRLPMLRDLGRDIEFDLAILEEHRVDSTETACGCPSVWEARARILRRTGGALCRTTSIGSGGPGVDIVSVWTEVRVGEADAVAKRVQLWLDSELSHNLRESLGCRPGSERHAVLVFDRLTEPEVATAETQQMAFRPTGKLRLPVEVDVLWLIVGPVACRYSCQHKWQTVRRSGGAALDPSERLQLSATSLQVEPVDTPKMPGATGSGVAWFVA